MSTGGATQQPMPPADGPAILRVNNNDKRSQMRIYNLFPLLAGPLPDWTPHLQRAVDLGFDWIYVNPIQQSGHSGSLYSIADYFSIDQRFLKPRSGQAPDEQVRDMTGKAADLGLSVMTDLVINHCAVDSRLVREHPQWFKRDGDRVANPYCVEADGSRTVWRDLAQFDHARTSDPDGLLDYCCKVVEHLVDLGFKGLRCDAAYQIPTPFWRRLIKRTRAAHPGVIFLAETLGCTPTQTRNTASAGFDYVFNSSKWWDFSSPWLLEQYDLTRDMVPSISFPESHDTERLYRRIRAQRPSAQTTLSVRSFVLQRRDDAHRLRVRLQPALCTWWKPVPNTGNRNRSI